MCYACISRKAELTFLASAAKQRITDKKEVATELDKTDDYHTDSGSFAENSVSIRQRLV